MLKNLSPKRKKMNVEKIYIAGPMRGYPCFNFERFFYWAFVLRISGYTPLNPAEHDCVTWLETGRIYTPSDYDDLIKFDLEWIEKEADALFMLNGWEKSEGALQEYEKAKELGLQRFYESDYDHLLLPPPITVRHRIGIEL